MAPGVRDPDGIAGGFDSLHDQLQSLVRLLAFGHVGEESEEVVDAAVSLALAAQAHVGSHD
jgi:hypothetical protein